MSYKWQIRATIAAKTYILFETITKTDAIDKLNWFTSNESPQFLWVNNNISHQVNKFQITELYIISPELQQLEDTTGKTFTNIWQNN